MRPRPLPPELAGPFTVAAAREAGVGRARMRAADLDAPFHGVRAARSDAAARAEDAIVRAAHAYATRMRGCEFFSGVTSAVLWGVPLPSAVLFEPDPTGARVVRRPDVGVLLPARAAHSARVRAVSISPHLGSVRTHPGSGLRVTSPATTWASLGATLTRDDLVAVGDAFVRVPMRSGHPPALATIDELRAAVDAGRRRGVARLREALPLIRERSMSRQETRLRLLLHDERMPEPELNWPVTAPNGSIIALVDAAYPHQRVALEYEGQQHLVDETQWRTDIGRYERRAAFLARVRQGLAARS